MKNFTLLTACLFIINCTVYSQSPHAARLYGMTEYGGNSSKGSIFHYTPSTNDFTTDYDFQIKVKGKTPKCEIVTGNNGKYYGTTTAGGAYNAGVLFEWDSVTSVYNAQYEFGGADGSDARGAMILYNNKLYGMTNKGGANNYGVIYEWDIAAHTYTKKIDLDSATGRNPTGSLTLLNNIFYGFTSSGGLHDKGVLFEWNPATNVYSKKFDFDSIRGSNPVGKLAPFNGKLYAMCNKGGAYDAGTIYQWDYAGNTVTKTFDFNNTNGAFPMGYLTLYNNKFYGTTYEGGIHQTTGLSEHYGVIFEYNPVNNIFTKKKDLGYVYYSNLRRNHGPMGSLTLRGNVFWGTTTGGSFGSGSIFSWNPATNEYADYYYLAANNPCELVNTSIGGAAYESLFLSGDYLLGTTSEGGGSFFGCLYKFYPDSSQIVSSVNMQAADGAYPKGSLTKLGKKLFGLTFQGGNSHAGNIFEWDLHTQQFTERLQFIGFETGIEPKGSLTWYNGKFYGINTYGKSIAGLIGSGLRTGASWYNREPGDYFSWDPTTDAYQSLLSANYARATPVLFNNKLYTTTDASPGSPGGAISAYNPATNTLTEVAFLPPNYGTFDNYQDEISANGVTYYNGKFYGMTPAKYNSGAIPFRGTIYEWDTTTTVMAHRYDFIDSLGTYPTGNLVLVNNEFYGLTSNIGNYSGSYPSLFKWNPVTNVFQKMKAYFSEYAYGSPTYSGGKIYFLTEGSYLNLYEYDPIRDTTINVHSESISLFGVGGGWNYTNCRRPPSYQQLLEVIPNEAPVLVSSPFAQNICVNKMDSTTFTITDKDVDTMHFHITSSNSGLLPVSNISVTNISNLYTITYFGNINQTGSATISLTANDGYGDSVSFSFTVNVTNTQGCSLLPVELTSFNALRNTKTVLLTWQIATELNTNGYGVERSVDGFSFTQLGFVKSGNGNTGHSYQFTDILPAKGVNYYRLKIIGTDGKYIYSSIRKVQFVPGENDIFIYPNPVSDQVYVENNSGRSVHIEMTDLRGRKIYEAGNLTSHLINLDVSMLPAGVYVLRINDGIKVESKKIIKE